MWTLTAVSDTDADTDEGDKIDETLCGVMWRARRTIATVPLIITYLFVIYNHFILFIYAD